MATLLLRKLPFLKDPVRLSPGESAGRLLPQPPFSLRIPEAPRATHCFGVELVPRLRQYFIHPRLVHESDEAETPARRSEGEADGYMAVSGSGEAGRAGCRRRESGAHLDLLVRGSRITRHSFTSPNWPKYSRSPSVTTHPPLDQPGPHALPLPPSFAPGDPGAARPPPRQAARALSTAWPPPCACRPLQEPPGAHRGPGKPRAELGRRGGNRSGRVPAAPGAASQKV